MNNKLLINTLLVCLIVTGCVSNLSTMSPQLTDTQVADNGVSMPTITNLPTVLYTALPRATEPFTNWEAAKRCATVSPSRPDTYKLTGVAAVRSLSSKILGLELSLIDLAGGSRTKISTPNPVDDAEVSPDRKTAGYIHFNTSNSKRELTLIDAMGKIQKTVWSSDTSFSLEGWPNNHQIIIFQDGKITIVDIVQNSRINLSPSDFPNFDSNLFYPYIAFDPSITRVIYKSGKIILLDLSTKTIIAQINDSYDRAPIVDWQPSGERAAIVVPIPAKQKTYGSPDEIFIVERDGQSRQLTHLYETFGLILNIDSLSWSPDGGKISFWLADGQGDETLMVADAMTGDVVNYCILNLGTTNFPRGLAAPIWSPDGKYLMVENRYSPDSNKLLVLDLLNNVAFPIAENENPVGWMLEGK